MKTDILKQTQQAAQLDDIADLVHLARQDITYFQEIFERFFLPIHNYTLSRVGDRQAAQDIVSQTFLAALEGLRNYQEKGQFSAWIFTIARSKINDHFRSQKRLSENTIEDIPALGEDLLARRVQDEQINALRMLIKKLPQKKQELIRLRYVANLSFKDIAAITGRSEGSAKKALYRILDDLKDELENDHV